MIKKIILVAFIIVGISWAYTKFKPTPSTQTQVLGVSTNVLKNVSNSFPAQSVGVMAHNLLDTSSHFASNIASSAATTVTDFAFDVATKPIVEKINNLPPEKKIEITNALCK